MALIANEYVPKRLEQIRYRAEDTEGCDLEAFEDLVESLDNKGYLIERFYQDIKDMSDFVRVPDYGSSRLLREVCKNAYDEVIFEGAQGLAIGEKTHRHHSTPSDPGITTPRFIVGTNSSIEAYYVSRAYTTRHGNGPFPEEEYGGSYDFSDDTNTDHKWQGKFRVAPLCIETLLNRINQDFRGGIDPNLVITCLDHTLPNGKQIPIYLSEEALKDGIMPLPKSELVGTLKMLFQDSVYFRKGKIITSSGPTRETITEESVTVKRSKFA